MFGDSFKLIESYGPSVHWPNSKGGWILSSRIAKEIELIPLLQDLDHCFGDIPRLNPISLGDYFGSEVACLEQFQHNQPFFYVALCSFMATKALPEVTVQFEWNQEHQAGLISGVPQRLLGKTLAVCIELLTQLVTNNNDHNTSSILLNLRQCNQHAFDFFAHPFTTSVLQCLQKQSIPFFPILLSNNPGFPILQIGECSNSFLIHSSSTNQDSLIGGFFCNDKRKSHVYLSALGLPVPRQVELPIDAKCFNFLELKQSIGSSKLVVKPDQSERGYGITLNVASQKELIQAIHVAKPLSSKCLLVQEQVDGFYYRLSVVNGQIIRIYRAQPPFLLGDGRHSIDQLMHYFLQAAEHDHICIEPASYSAFLRRVEDLGYSLQSIPIRDEKIVLPYSLNDRRDWIIDDFNPAGYPYLARLASTIVVNFDLANVGIDIICDDINDQDSLKNARVIELNAVQTLATHSAEDFISCHPLATTEFRVLKSVAVVLDFSIDRIQQLIASLPSTAALAVQNHAFPEGQLAFLAELCGDRLQLYEHPQEIFLNRQTLSLCFLLSQQQLTHSGFPCRHDCEHFFIIDGGELHQSSTQEELISCIGSTLVKVDS